jgi:single-strand DNA-binding protein
MYLNKCMVYGNLTRDPEMKALPSGQNVTTMSIATNRTYKDKDGKQQEEVDYHNIVVWGKQAENCAKYLTKGSSAFIEGRMTTRSWEKDGVKQYRTEIVAESVQFGPKKDSQATTDKSESALPDYPEDEINPEDIPFKSEQSNSQN